MLTGLVIAWVIAVPILTSMQPPPRAWISRRTRSHLAHAGAVHRRGRDRGRGDLHAGEAREAGGRRAREHAHRFAVDGGPRRSRPRSLAAVDLALTVRLLIVAGWLAFTLRAFDGAGAIRVDAHADRRAVRAARRLPDRRDLRLHGGAHRRVEQPDLGRRAFCRSCSAHRCSILAVPPTPETRPALVAFALFMTAIVFACATISNDNLQDLKTGQLVGASPMRQQIALIVGVAAGAAVIPSVLNLLAKAYGFAGAAERRRRRAQSAAGATGDAHLRARPGRDRRQPRMEDDRHRRARGRGTDSARHGAGRDEEAAHSAAGGRHRDLPADVGDVRGGRGRGALSLVRRRARARRTPNARSDSARSSPRD